MPIGKKHTQKKHQLLTSSTISAFWMGLTRQQMTALQLVQRSMKGFLSSLVKVKCSDLPSITRVASLAIPTTLPSLHTDIQQCSDLGNQSTTLPSLQTVIQQVFTPGQSINSSRDRRTLAFLDWQQQSVPVHIERQLTLILIIWQNDYRIPQGRAYF